MKNSNLFISLRFLLKNKIFTGINILGLTIGIAFCIIISLYVLHELSYDNFHNDASSIYRVCLLSENKDNYLKMPYTPPPLGNVLYNDYSEVLLSTRTYYIEQPVVIKYKDVVFTEKNLCYGDTNFFNMFNFNIIKGDFNTLLSNPYNIVVTKSTAKKYFGQEEPIGKQFIINENQIYTVTGLIDDIPTNSHFSFDFIASLSSLSFIQRPNWCNNSLQTFVRLKKNTNVSKLQKKFIDIYRMYFPLIFGDKVTYNQYIKDNNKFEIYLESFKNLHVQSNFIDDYKKHGAKKNIVIFSLVGFFILMISIVNYINLSTAFYTNRLKEFGLKKVLGAEKTDILISIITESIIIYLIAFFIALFTSSIGVNFINNAFRMNLEYDIFQKPFYILIFIAIVVLLAIFSGTFPGLYFSSIKIVNMLRKKANSNIGKIDFRSFRLILQFTACIFIINTMIFINNQYQYLKTKDKGFNKKGLVIVHNAELLGNNTESFKQEAEKLSEINSVSTTNSLPGYNIQSSTYYSEKDNDPFEFYLFYTNLKSLEILDIQLKEGRFFFKGENSDKNNVIINERAVKKFNIKDPIGYQLKDIHGNYNVIGVIRNFHYKTLHNKIEPLIIHNFGDSTGRFVIASINMNSKNSLSELGELWSRYLNSKMMKLSFLENDLNNQYSAENQMKYLFSFFSIIVIIISCIGLISLISYDYQKRMKEIAIRKILGASLLNIYFTLSQKTLFIITISNLIALPFTYWYIKNWLQNFAYKEALNYSTFIFTIILSLLFLLLFISYHTYRAATANPIDALKDE